MNGHETHGGNEHHHHPGTPRPVTHDHASMMADPVMAATMERDMRRRFWVALAFTIPVTLLAGHLPGVPMLVHPPLANWLELMLSIPVVWWAGRIFISGSYHALRSRKLDMSVLIATGVLAAFGIQPIAAASIVAKVTRDRIMVELDHRYPEYGFSRHKGYGTPEHRAAIARLGLCPIHRRSFCHIDPHPQPIDTSH